MGFRGGPGPLRDYEYAKRPLGPCQPCAISARTGGRTRSKQHHDSLSIAPSPSKGWRARRDLRSPLRRAPTNHLGKFPLTAPDPTEEVRHAIPNRPLPHPYRTQAIRHLRALVIARAITPLREDNLTNKVGADATTRPHPNRLTLSGCFTSSDPGTPESEAPSPTGTLSVIVPRRWYRASRGLRPG